MHRRLMLILAVLALAAAACGSTDATVDGVATLETQTTEADPTETTLSEVDTEEQLIAFTQCMRDEGVGIGDPVVDADGNVSFGGVVGQEDDGAPGGRPEGFREATQACGEFLDGIELGFGRGDITELEDTLLEFAQCMRDNGYQMDDPDLSNFGPPDEGEDGEQTQGGGPFGDVDFEDPAFIAAQEACFDILGGFGPGGRGPVTGGEAGN